MEDGAEEDYHAEALFLCLVTEGGSACDGSGETTKEGQCVKSFFRCAPSFTFGLPFVPAVDEEGGDTEREQPYGVCFEDWIDADVHARGCALS